MKKLVFALIALATLTMQGCVTAGKYDKLKQESDQTSEDLSECQKKNHDLDVLVSDLQSKLGSTSTEKSKLEGDVAEMKTALELQARQRADAEKRIQEFRDFVKTFKSLIDTGQLTVRMIDGKMVVTLSSDVLFASGSARLSKQGAEAVQAVTKLLASVPNRNYQVEGYTDNVPIKNSQFPSNWELASARSLTVVKAMLDAGMPAERVSAASFGDTHPVKSNETDKGKLANRRIAIVVVPDLSKLPGYDQLQKMSNP